MSLPTLFKAVSCQLSKLSPVYDLASREHTSLAAYPTLDTLLSKLKGKGKGVLPERKALVCSLIDLHRASPHALWSTVLLYACANMLKKIRRKLRGDDSETRDAIVIESFLETLTDVRTDDVKRIFMYVRQGTRRRAFKELGERALWEAVGFGVEADLEPDPTTLEEPTLRGVWLREAGVSEESVQLLATVGDRGALWTLVRKQHSDGDGAQQERTFRCLQKRRDRLVVRLRNRLREEEACPGP